MNKVRVGVIGIGSWGQCHLEAYQACANAEIVAICDRNEARLRQVGERFGIDKRFVDVEDFMRENLDLVSIVTFEDDHFHPAVAALRSGKHVIVEKPISTRLEEAQQMLAEAKSAGKHIIPGHLLRFDPRYAQIHQRIQSGRIGQVGSMYLKRSRQKSWFATYQRIHTVYELTIHDLDLAIWYAQSRVTHVRSHARYLLKGDAPDLLWSSLQFENGTIAFLQSNWLTPDAAGIAIADAVEVIGSEGKAYFDTEHAGLQVWEDTGRSSEEFDIHALVNGNAVGALRNEIDYICRCIGNGTEPSHVSFEDAVHGIAVANAIVQSAEQGIEIQL